MPLEQQIPRRSFFRITAAVAVSAGLFGAGCALERKRWRSFSDSEARLVDDISEVIIPSDLDPGGRFAGVVNYIDLQLTGPYARFAALYRDSLPRVANTAQAVFGKPWAQLSFAQQTEIMAALEKGETPEGIWEPGRASEFFGTVRDHCMQGYYGPPRHGGNREYVSYRVIGLAYPQICPREPQV